MEPSWTENLLRNNGNHKQNEKTTCGMGENIDKRCNPQGIKLQNIQFMKLNIKKTEWKKLQKL